MSDGLPTQPDMGPFELATGVEARGDVLFLLQGEPAAAGHDAGPDLFQAANQGQEVFLVPEQGIDAQGHRAQ